MTEALDSEPKIIQIESFEFQNFIKGKYNQGRKNILSTFLRKKFKILLRNKISKKKNKFIHFLNSNAKPKKHFLSINDVYSTLFHFFEEYYNKNKESISQKANLNKKIPYSLSEDVKLFLVIYMSNNRSSYDEEFSNTFESIVKEWGFYRSIESLRDRYKRFLKKMTINDWKIVVNHIESHGLEGVLQFNGPKNDKKFVRVDVAIVKKDGKNSNCKISENVIALKTKLNNFEEVKKENEEDTTLENKKSSAENIGEFYKNRKDVLLWFEEDDEILKNTKSVEDYGFKILLRYKGKISIKNRLKNMNIALPFKLE